MTRAFIHGRYRLSTARPNKPSYILIDIAGKNFGVTLPLVNCSKAYAYLIKVGSLQAVPKKNIPASCLLAGNAGKLPEAAIAGTSRMPIGTVIEGYPATAA